MSASEMESAKASTLRLDLVHWLRLFDEAGPQLMTLLGLHGQLLYLELQQEKHRLQWVMLGSALSISFVVLALLFAGFAVLYLNRNNESFILFIWLLPAVFILLAVTCFLLVRRLGRQGQTTFSASYHELIQDIQLLLRREA